MLFIFNNVIGGLSPGVVAAIAGALFAVAGVIIVSLTMWRFKTRKNVWNSDGETTAENSRSDSATVMKESSAYGQVPAAERNIFSDLKMQESRAYGVGTRENRLPRTFQCMK